jgi:hypothetical protein
VIRGHPTITRFECVEDFPYAASGGLYSALAALPALKAITLTNDEWRTRPEDESMANPESLTELLRIPSLRFVSMLQENASLESLTVQSRNISFELKDVKYLALVTALQRNKTLKTLSMYPKRSFTLTHDEGKQMAALLKKTTYWKVFQISTLRMRMRREMWVPSYD